MFISINVIKYTNPNDIYIVEEIHQFSHVEEDHGSAYLYVENKEQPYKAPMTATEYSKFLEQLKSALKGNSNICSYQEFPFAMMSISNIPDVETIYNNFRNSNAKPLELFDYKKPTVDTSSLN